MGNQIPTWALHKDNAEINFLKKMYNDFVDASSSFHNEEDCKIEGWTDCEFCRIIKKYRWISKTTTLV